MNTIYMDVKAMMGRHSNLKYFTYENRKKHVWKVKYAFTHECGVTEEQYHQLRDISISSEDIEKDVLFDDCYTEEQENAMVQYAVVFEAVYNSLKLGIDWKKLAKYKRIEHWTTFSDYLKDMKEMFNANTSNGYGWYDENVNPEEWFKSEKSFYRHLDNVYEIYNALPEELQGSLKFIMEEFDSIFSTIDEYSDEYLGALIAHIMDPDCCFPHPEEINRFLKCAYVICCMGKCLNIK